MDNLNFKKIANALNISTSTVSRAFRGATDINKETKKRILDLAEEMNYQPNQHAINLREKKSRTIAVIVPELSNNFFLQAINGLERVASKRGYHILIYQTHNDYEKEVSFINDLSNGRVDGIIMSVTGEAAKDHKYLNRLREKNIPLIFFDRIYDDVETAKVTTDDYKSSFDATRHLIESGSRRISFLVIDKNLSIGKMRLQGYQDALENASIPYRDELVIDCNHNNEKNHKILRRVLTTLKPDGIFASVERLAIVSYYVCQELNISIPEEVKIIGFSSLEIASILNPSLTTITQPAFEMGTQAANLFFKAIAGDENKWAVKDQIVLKSKIIKRKSTAS